MLISSHFHIAKKAMCRYLGEEKAENTIFAMPTLTNLNFF